MKVVTWREPYANKNGHCWVCEVCRWKWAGEIVSKKRAGIQQAKATAPAVSNVNPFSAAVKVPNTKEGLQQWKGNFSG